MSNQIQINTVILPDGTTGIEVNDGSKPDGHVEDHTTFTYERSDIPQSLIDECNKLGEESDKIFFIFDKKIKNIVNRNNKSIEVLRDIKIEEVLDDDFKYYIADENEFNSMPSRFAYYDSEIRLSDRYDRYNHVLNFFKILNFNISPISVFFVLEFVYFIGIKLSTTNVLSNGITFSFIR